MEDGVHYYYRLIMLGDECSLMDDIASGFMQRCSDDFRIPSERIRIEKNPADPIHGKDLECCVYFSRHKFRGQPDSRLDEFLKYSVPIIPVITPDGDILGCMPSNLGDHNALPGLLYDYTLRKAIETILSCFGLIRTERKIFISYRRSDGSKVAMQLFSEFAKRGYQVFLDTVSVRKGDLIQDEIWHQMADSDLVLMLGTPEYPDSTWCRDEFHTATARRIGGFALIWPDVAMSGDRDVSWELVPNIRLENECFRKDGCLRAKTLRRIADRIEELRIGNLAARKRLLVDEFIGSERDNHVETSYDCVRNIIRCDSTKYYPITGVPKSADFDRARKIGPLYILYYAPQVRKSWTEYLKWVNASNLQVKTKGFGGVQ